MLTLGLVHFVDETGQDVTVINVEVVVGAEHVGRNDRCVLDAVLVSISP